MPSLPFKKPSNWPRNRLEARYNPSLALMQIGERECVARELRQVVAQKPDLVNARNALGTVLQDLGDLEGAVEQFRMH